MARVRKRLGSHGLCLVVGALLYALCPKLMPSAVARSEPGSSAQRFLALDSFAQALSLIGRAHVDEVSERRLIYGAIAGMVGELDPHSDFYPPAQYQRLREDTEGEFGGVGLDLQAPDFGPPILSQVVVGSPAHRAGLAEGDSLLQVQRTSTVDTKGEATLTTEEVLGLLRGATGTRVVLVVSRKEWSEPRSFTLVRKRVALPSVQIQRIDDVLHIEIDRFREATTRDLRKHLSRELKKGVKALILDLRGNPGGLLNQGIAVSDLFLHRGIIVTVLSRGGREQEVSKAKREGTIDNLPMVVIVDQNSASASEIVAAALRDNGRASLVGTATYGKGSVQTFLDLRDGSGLKLTTQRYLTPKGETLEGVGLTPRYPVEAFEADVIRPMGMEGKAGERQSKLSKIHNGVFAGDPQLYKAFQVVNKR